MYMYIGPEMLAFLKKRRAQKQASKAPDGDKESKMDTSEPQPTTKSSSSTTKDTLKEDGTKKNADSSERSQPGKWLHMDVVEKEKLEWMTDVPLYPQDSSSSSTGEGEPKEVRFSLDGLVIPRSVMLPVHLGLHHHGDEPQVNFH